jgi:cyanophycin synthetase
MRVQNGRVLVDYAHNPAAIRGLMDFVQSIDATRRIALVTAPGDRRDEDLREVGRIVAHLDYVIVKEDKERRGRQKGDIADLIVDGLMDGGMSENQYEVIFTEAEAIQHALGRMKDNDLVVILADDVKASIEYVRKYSPDGARS